jgi:hypothetical protein
MSDDLKDDYSGATKGVFAAVGVMLLAVGGEMIAEKEGLRVGLGLFLVLLGCLFFYAAAFWRTSRKVLSTEAQSVIARFAASYVTWALILFLLFQTLILSRFIEGHRWPFSYPTDPAILADNSKLHKEVNDLNKQVGELTQPATKWKFIHEMRSDLGANRCSYIIYSSQNDVPEAFRWQEQLRDADWVGSVSGGIAPEGVLPRGITIRSTNDNGLSNICARALQKALSDVYSNSNQRVNIETNQSTNLLRNCGAECVEIDIN